MTDLKRRLTDIKFEHEGAHVALVGKHQGGPANGITTLVTKATNAIDQATVDKATQVTVTLDFEEFLRKFFNMYWEDAEILARALGFADDTEDDDIGVDYWKEYIDEKVSQINIMKGVYKAQDVSKALSELSPAEMLSLLQTQEILEKAMKTALPKGTELTDPEETHMTNTILKSAHEELLSKAVDAAVAPVQKALDDQTVILKAAQDEIAVFKAAAAEAVTKARTDSLVEAGQTAESAAEIVKSLAGVADDAFAVVLKGYQVQKAAEANNPLFKEQGVNGVGEPDQAKIDKTAEILKAKYQTKTTETK